MAATTPRLQLPYPTPPDSVDVPRDVKALADKLDPLVATQDDLVNQGTGSDAALKQAVPAGVIQMWPGAAAPTGWFLCQGQPVPAAENPGLAAIFGQAGGNVTLPDLRGRTVLGVSGTYALRSTGGAATVTLSTAEMPSHTHAGVSIAGRSIDSTGGANVLRATTFDPDRTIAQAQAGIVLANTGGGGAHENLPPYMALNWIIRAG